jgi:hypothetical protein
VQASIENQPVCVGSTVMAAGRIADTLYYRAVLLHMARLQSATSSSIRKSDPPPSPTIGTKSTRREIVEIDRADVLALDAKRPTLYSDTLSHQLGGRGARSTGRGAPPAEREVC